MLGEQTTAALRTLLAGELVGKLDDIARVSLSNLLSREPYNGQGVVRQVASSLTQANAAAICIPAHDEAACITRTIDAALVSAAHAQERTCLVILVNNTSDATFALAEERLRAEAVLLDWVVADVALDPAIAHIGFARRLCLDLAATLPGVEYLLSTDADTLVAEDWVACAIAGLRETEMVCGKVTVDPAELAALPDSVSICGAVEGILAALLTEIWHKITGPATHGFLNKGSGANLAIRSDSYRQSGGLPTLMTSEDRAMHTLFQRQGRSIAHDSTMLVTTSCRLVSRTKQGMADCLRARAADPNPFIDGQLTTLAHLIACAHHAKAQPGMTIIPEKMPGYKPLRTAQAIPEIARARQYLKDIRAAKSHV